MFTKLCTLILGCVILYGCSNLNDNQESKKNTRKIAVGKAEYGGHFRFMTPEKIQSLFPPTLVDIYTSRLSSLIFEGLFHFGENSAELKSCIAEGYEVSKDLKVYTIKIKEGIYFHDDDCFPDGIGREVVATDIKYLFDFICSSDESNNYSDLFKNKIVGANSYYLSGNKPGENAGVEGVKVVDNYTVSIELNQPEVAFEKYLAHSGLFLFPKESIEKYGSKVGLHPVGTGPFILSKMTSKHVLVRRNENYWQVDEMGNRLPYLDSISVMYSNDKKEELISFRDRKIDLVTKIPADHIENVLLSLKDAQLGKNVKHKINSRNSLRVEYCGFNQSSSLFKDIRVRKAFNLVIDKQTIIETLLNGEGWEAKHGFVPHMNQYPEKSVKGFDFNVDEAKRLMTEAGYENGVGFPEITLVVSAAENSSNSILAKAIVDNLQNNLNISVKIIYTTLNERDKMIEKGRAIFWRAGWIADIPDPMDFLGLFYSKKNKFGYSNPEFDALFDASRTEKNQTKRMEMLAKCDQMIIDDAVVIPLITNDFVSVINARVKNFEVNEMEGINFSRIFIKEFKR
ncbi:MAG: ABC transporter substrate-binding protein [Lishizhenia sp.]